MTDHIQLARASVSIIQAGQHSGGAYVASPTFPVYRFAWLRDGAFIADAMSRAGDVAGAEAFFGWCASVLASRAGQVQQLLESQREGRPVLPEDFPPTRYTLSGEAGSEEWWDFQLDGYGTWLWALAAHCRRHARSARPFAAGARISARYVTEFWSIPCFDWWEEHPEQVHTSTIAAIAAGLGAALELGVLAGSDEHSAVQAEAEIRDAIDRRAVHRTRYSKWLDGDGLDASLISLSTPFGLVPAGAAPMRETIAAIEAELAHGGVHRYSSDTFYGGGEWVLLSALLGWHYMLVGRPADALSQLEWVAAQADSELRLPEQVSDHLLAPEHYQPWVDRWGPPARPLLWSHAMYLTLALEAGQVGTAEVMD